MGIFVVTIMDFIMKLEQPMFIFDYKYKIINIKARIQFP